MTPRRDGAKPLTKAQLNVLEVASRHPRGFVHGAKKTDMVSGWVHDKTAKRLSEIGLLENYRGVDYRITPQGRAELARHEATPDVVRWQDNEALKRQFWNAVSTIDPMKGHLAVDRAFGPNYMEFDGSFVDAMRMLRDAAEELRRNGTLPAATPAVTLKPLGIVDDRPACPECGHRDTSCVSSDCFEYQCDSCGHMFAAAMPDNGTGAAIAPKETLIQRMAKNPPDTYPVLSERQEAELAAYRTTASAPAEPQPSDVTAAKCPTCGAYVPQDNEGMWLVCTGCGKDWYPRRKTVAANLTDAEYRECHHYADSYVEALHAELKYATYPASALTAAEAATVAAAKTRRGEHGVTYYQPSDVPKLLAILERLTTPPQPDALPDGVTVEREDTTDSRGKPFTAIEVRCNATLWIEVRRYVRPRDGSTQIAVVPHERPLSIDEARSYHAALGIALDEAAKLERERGT